MEESLQKRLLRIRLLLVDNDAVLTDGRIVFGDYGDELKFFDVQDGHGLVMMRRAGVPVVVLSGRKSRVNDRRAKDVQVTKIYQDVKDKAKVYQKILKKFKLAQDDVCYIGDDLVDIPVLKRCGFAVAVANAVPEVKSVAHYVTERSGGRGAVREVCDLLLKAQGKWAQATAKYYL